MRATFAGDVTAPAHARHFVTDGLETIVEPGTPPPGDELLLIVSELVTNAVRAGAATIAVDVRATPERVDLCVTDDAPGWPRKRDADLEDDGGRGLAIVERLADTWTTTSKAGTKTVVATWFRR